MEPPAPRPLSYDTQPPARWHRYSRWAVLAMCVIVAAVLLIKAGPILFSRIRLMELERAALAAKVKQSPLLAADGATHVPSEWNDLADAIPWMDSPVFVASRKSKAGQRIVIVIRLPMTDGLDSGKFLDVFTAIPASLLNATQEPKECTGVTLPVGATIDSATLDPKDERHFILTGHGNGGTITLDGWLLDTGGVTLQYRPTAGTQSPYMVSPQ